MQDLYHVQPLGQVQLQPWIPSCVSACKPCRHLESAHMCGHTPKECHRLPFACWCAGSRAAPGSLQHTAFKTPTSCPLLDSYGMSVWQCAILGRLLTRRPGNTRMIPSHYFHKLLSLLPKLFSMSYASGLGLCVLQTTPHSSYDMWVLAGTQRLSILHLNFTQVLTVTAFSSGQGESTWPPILPEYRQAIRLQPSTVHFEACTVGPNLMKWLMPQHATCCHQSGVTA